MIHIEGDAIKSAVAYAKEYVDSCFVSTGATESVYDVLVYASIHNEEAVETRYIYPGPRTTLAYDRSLLANNESGELYHSGGHYDYARADYNHTGNYTIVFNYSFGRDNNLYLGLKIKPKDDIGVSIDVLHPALFSAWYIAKELPDVLKIGDGSFSAMVDNCMRHCLLLDSTGESYEVAAKQMVAFDLASKTLYSIKCLTRGPFDAKDIKIQEIYAIVKYCCKHLSMEILEAFMSIVSNPVLNMVVCKPSGALTDVEILTSIYKMAKHDETLTDQQRDIIMKAREVYYRVPHVPIC